MREVAPVCQTIFLGQMERGHRCQSRRSPPNLSARSSRRTFGERGALGRATRKPPCMHCRNVRLSRCSNPDIVLHARSAKAAITLGDGGARACISENCRDAVSAVTPCTARVDVAALSLGELGAHLQEPTWYDNGSCRLAKRLQKAASLALHHHGQVMSVKQAKR